MGGEGCSNIFRVMVAVSTVKLVFTVSHWPLSRADATSNKRCSPLNAHCGSATSAKGLRFKSLYKYFRIKISTKGVKRRGISRRKSHKETLMRKYFHSLYNNNKSYSNWLKTQKKPNVILTPILELKYIWITFFFVIIPRSWQLDRSGVH